MENKTGARVDLNRTVRLLRADDFNSIGRSFYWVNSIYLSYMVYIVHLYLLNRIGRGIRNMAIKVSVVVLIYNPSMDKLKNTLNSITMQKNIDFEVIIADDGSLNIDRTVIEQWAYDRFDIERVKFVWNEQNQGTIKNYLSAVKEASGTYVYGISPGDYLYDEDVLRDLYQFAESNNVDVCFGNVQCYVNREGKQVLVRRMSPENPEFFALEHSRGFLSSVAFFFGQFAIGATYFRKRTFLLDCLKKLAGTVVYIEDTASTFIYLLEGGRLLYYDRLVVFYESNSGISTNKSHPLAQKFKKDEEAIGDYVKTHYRNNPIVRYKWIDPHILRIVYHPCVFACVIWNKLCKLTCKNRKQTFGDIRNLEKIQNFKTNEEV